MRIQYRNGAFEVDGLAGLARIGGQLSAAMVQQGLDQERPGLLIDKRWHQAKGRTYYVIVNDTHLISGDWTPRAALQGLLNVEASYHPRA